MCEEYIILSSAKSATEVQGVVGCIAKYRLKRIGENMAPWGSDIRLIGDLSVI